MSEGKRQASSDGLLKGAVSLLLVSLVVALLAELIDGAPGAGAVIGGILFTGVVGFLVVSARHHRRSQDLAEKSPVAPVLMAAVCQSCGATQALATGACQRCGAARATSTLLTPRNTAISAGVVVLTLLGKFVLKMAERKARTLPWWLVLVEILLGVVAIIVFLVLARPSAFGSKVASTLGQLVKLDDGRFGAMALKEVTPAEWLDAQWPGSAPDAFLAAVSIDANHWVLSGKVDGLPMMLVCIEYGTKPNARPAELHLLIAYPPHDQHPPETEPHERLTAQGCEVHLSFLGVYISHDKLKDILSIEQLRAICLHAVELAREGPKVAPCS